MIINYDRLEKLVDDFRSALYRAVWLLIVGAICVVFLVWFLF